MIHQRKLNHEQGLIRNFIMSFFSALFIVFVTATIALLKTLMRFPIPPRLSTVTIEYCYDGDTCTTLEGEKIRLACIDAPELKGRNADPIAAKAARDYLNRLIEGSTVKIRRFKRDRYSRTVAELYKDLINVPKELVEKNFARIHERYRNQCAWSKSFDIKDSNSKRTFNIQ